MRVLDKEFLGMGTEVRLFEERLSDFFGRPAVCVVNGTAALHLALQACDISLGDEVLVPSITYVASFQAISATGATPVACDVEIETLCLDCRDAEKRITEKTKAIMPVHYSGGVGNLDEIYNLSNKYNLRVIEDAAHAFGSFYKNQKVGSFGDISCFSFDGIKNITSGEGGCIVTENQRILELVKDARLLGVEKDTEKRYQGQRSWKFEVSKQGWRYHMSDIMAAIGVEQLKRFAEIKGHRQKIAKYYFENLKNNKRIDLLSLDYDLIVPHIFVGKLDNSISRDGVIESMLEKGIQCGFHYFPNHQLSLYKSLKYFNNVIPRSTKVFESLLTLPLHESITEVDAEYIVNCLLEILSVG